MTKYENVILTQLLFRRTYTGHMLTNIMLNSFFTAVNITFRLIHRFPTCHIEVLHSDLWGD